MKNKKCEITKSESCSCFNLYYAGAQLHINYKTLVSILTKLYQYDNLEPDIKKEKPFRIKIEPVLLTIHNKDFSEFKLILEEVICENSELPKSNLFKIFQN